ncbi:MAG: hypothetical protein LW823_02750 [Rickettsiales bacterium]|jgi:hypothetical protein|nr:hypothetical protein [Rickettsiales bacterium]
MTDPFFITIAKTGWRGAHDLQQEGVLPAAMAMARNEPSIEQSRGDMPQAHSRGWSR